MKIYATLFAVALLLNSPLGHAEDPEKGRLADGRAYRTDTQGNQLVDYIAELELQIDGLNKKIGSLEDELDQKDASLAQLKSNPNQKLGEIKERDIGRIEKTSDTQQQPISISCPKLECPTTTCERTECPSLSCPQLDCSSDIESIRTQLGNQINNLKLNLHSQEELLQQREAELKQARNDLSNNDKRSATLESKVAEFNSQNNSLSQQLDEVTTAKSEIETKLKLASQEIEKRKTNESILAEENKLLHSRLEIREAANQVAQPDSRAALSPSSSAKQRALESVRGMLKTEMNKMNGLINQRNQLFSEYQSGKFQMSAGKLQVSKSDLISSRGLTLTDINRQIAQIDSIGNLAALRRDIGEITNKLYDDIALIERLRRARR